MGKSKSHRETFFFHFCVSALKNIVNNLFGNTFGNFLELILATSSIVFFFISSREFILKLLQKTLLIILHVDYLENFKFYKKKWRFPNWSHKFKKKTIHRRISFCQQSSKKQNQRIPNWDQKIKKYFKVFKGSTKKI